MEQIRRIREKQDQLITLINATFDEIVAELERTTQGTQNYESDYESIYPITNTAGFKGKKPIAVLFQEERIITPTWKSVVEKILTEVMKNEENKNRIMSLRDKLYGRVRNRISESEEGMRSAIKLEENLYIETHYDTETLMKLLLQILDEIKYDYNKIKIIIKN